MPLLDDAPSRGVLFQQLTDLADLVLHGYKLQLDSLGHDFTASETLELKFQQDRTRLVAPLGTWPCPAFAKVFPALAAPFTVQVTSC